MAVESFEPYVRSAVRTPQMKTEASNATYQSYSTSTINKKTSDTTVHRTPKTYTSKDKKNKNGYVNKDDTVKSFNNQMSRYLHGIYSLLESDNQKDAKASLQTFLNDMYITTEDKIVIEFYRLVSFVESRLDTDNFKNEKMKLLGIVKNLQEGFE
jgi:hypothetical protein